MQYQKQVPLYTRTVGIAEFKVNSSAKSKQNQQEVITPEVGVTGSN